MLNLLIEISLLKKIDKIMLAGDISISQYSGFYSIYKFLVSSNIMFSLVNKISDLRLILKNSEKSEPISENSILTKKERKI